MQEVTPVLWYLLYCAINRAGKRRAHSDPLGPFVTFSTSCPEFFKVVPKSLVFPHTNHMSLVSHPGKPFSA